MKKFILTSIFVFAFLFILDVNGKADFINNFEFRTAIEYQSPSSDALKDFMNMSALPTKILN